MTTLKFMTVDQHLVLQRQPVVASGDKNSVLIQIQLCSMWDGFDVKVAFFKDGNRDFVLDIPLEKGECMVPPEMLDSPCVLNIGVWGKDAKGRYKTSTMVKYRVQEGTPIEAGLTLIDVSDGTAAEDQVLEGATFFAGDTEMKAGNVKTYEDGDPAYMIPYVEADPTVPPWAKQPTKPKYTASEVGARPATWTPKANEVGAPKAGKTVPDTTTAHTKTVPEDAAPYAEVLEIGGMTRKCTNLIPFPYVATSGSAFGSTYTIKDNGVIEFSGKPTSAYTVILYEKVFPAGSYYLHDGVTAAGINFIAYDIDGATVLSYEGAFTLSSSKKVRVYYLISVDFSGTTTAVYPMLNEGSTALPYEPYFDGLRSAPVTEVESVGVNLCKFVNGTHALKSGASLVLDNGHFELEISSSGALEISSSLWMPYTTVSLQEGTYTVSLNNYKGSFAGLYIKDMTNNTFLVNGGDKICKFAIDKETDVAFGIYLYFSTGANETISGDFMLNEGPTALPYAPCVRHTLPIPAEVQSLDGYGWGINESVYNYIDFEKKQFVKRVGCVDMGTLDWTSIDSKWFYAYPAGKVKALSNILCATYPNADTGFSAMGEKTVTGSVEYPYVYVKDTSYTDVATFKAAMSGVMLYYELATPIITDISDLLPADNLIGVESGGTVRMVNEYGYNVPNTLRFRTGNNDVIGADVFVGDLHGTAARAIADGEGKLLATREWVLEQLAALANGGDGE